VKRVRKCTTKIILHCIANLRRATRGKLERLGDVLQDADGAHGRITGNALEAKELLREVRMLGALRQRKNWKDLKIE